MAAVEQLNSPASLLREFASCLGWHGLQTYEHKLGPSDCGRYPVGTLITCYTTTDQKFFLQINEYPVGQKRRYQATVVAERYGLRPIDWQPFTIEDSQSAVAEASRMADVLSRSVLRNRRSRRKFIRNHLHLLDRRWVGRRTYRRLTRTAVLPKAR